MSDRLHTHLSFGYAPEGKCPACDQTRQVLKVSDSDEAEIDEQVPAEDSAVPLLLLAGAV